MPAQGGPSRGSQLPAGLLTLPPAHWRAFPHAQAAMDGARPQQQEWSVCAEFGVSLAFLRRFYDTHVAPLDEKAAAAGQPPLTTGEVVALVVKPLTHADASKRAVQQPATYEVGKRVDWDAASKAPPQPHGCRFVELPDVQRARDVWSTQRGEAGADMWFVSHAFANPLRLILAAYFPPSHVPAEDVYVWLDILAINQWDPGADLGVDGATLARTVAVSAGTLMVMDKAAVPLSRLWCARCTACAQASMSLSRVAHCSCTASDAQGEGACVRS